MILFEVSQGSLFLIFGELVQPPIKHEISKVLDKNLLLGAKQLIIL